MQSSSSSSSSSSSLSLFNTAKVASLDDEEQKETPKMFTLISSDQKEFVVEQRVALLSELIKTIAEGDKTENKIPLLNVNSKCLEKIVQYMTHHFENPPKEIVKPLVSSQMTEIVSSWDAEFINLDQEFLFELILAANYMDIKPLLDLVCAKIASMMKGKTTQQLRETFSIVNDFTPEEEQKVIEENKWVEES